MYFHDSKLSKYNIGIPYTIESTNIINISISDDDDNTNNEVSNTFGETEVTHSGFFTIILNTDNNGRKFGYGGFVSLDHHKPCCAKMMMDDKFFREVDDNCWSDEARIKECDKLGVDVQVLSTVPVMFSYWAKDKDTLVVAEFLNDHIADIVKRNPKRFIGLGTVPMQNPDLAINVKLL